MANPYLCYAALLMAGLDGIQNQIHPGEPMDKNLYDLPPARAGRSADRLRLAARSARQRSHADTDFLLKGDVFTDDQIDAYIELKWEEVDALGNDAEPGRVRHVLQRLNLRGHVVGRPVPGGAGRPLLFQGRRAGSSYRGVPRR